MKARPSALSRFSVTNNVQIGGGTKVLDQVNLYGCVIGKDCKIDSFTYIEAGVTIGNGCTIRAFAFIPQGVTIEDHVFIGPRVTFTNDKYPKKGVEFTMLKTRVCEGASIGASATILPGVTIGKGAFVGAGALVTKNVEEFAVVAGSPARKVGRRTEKNIIIRERDSSRNI